MLFKESYARGACRALGELGLVKFASEEEAAMAADQASESLPTNPVEEPVAPDATGELAAELVELSQQLEGTAQQAAVTAETAAAVTGDKMASRVMRIRQKLSSMGATSDPNDPTQKNTPENAAGVTGEMERENQDRPPMFANVGEDGVGTQVDSGEGAIASETERPDQDAKAVDQSNSVTDAIKGASLVSLIRKVAANMGSTLDPADTTQRNTSAQAASVTGEAQRERKDRPDGFALTGVGNSAMAAKMRASAVGTEQDHSADNPVKKPGTNSPIEQIAKSAEHVAYLQNFEQVSSKFASFLPAEASDEQKIAAIQFMMGQGPDERVKIAGLIKAAGEIPAALKEYNDKKKGDGEEKEEKEDKKNKEKDEETSTEKEAAIRGMLQGLHKLASISK